MSAQYLGCDVVPAPVLGDRPGGDRASVSHSAASNRGDDHNFTVYVSYMYKWDSKRR